MVVSYHASGYPFYCSDGGQRWTYYGIGGTPYVQVDGSWKQEVGGYAFPGTMYPYYRADFDTRKLMSSPLTIDLTCTYDSVTNTGTVVATVTNTTSSAVSGTIQFAVTENSIPYSWGPGRTTVEHVCRDMLPDGNGEAVTIPASGNIVKSRNFTIDAAWNEKKIFVVVFVQSSSKEVYQANQIVILPTPDMEYVGLTFTETSGNGNRVAQPGEAIRMYIKGKNVGTGPYSGPASISETDPYVTITGSTPQAININPMAWDTVLVTDVSISASCPSPHTVNFLLTFTNGDTCIVPFIVTNQPGFTDDMESGQGSWTHSGVGDNWHITTHRSHSVTHSWYCGVENTWQYTNSNDASLVTPYFVVTPDSSLKFWYWDSLELGYDYGFVDIDNGCPICGNWQTLATYNAGHLTWTQQTLSMANYYGQTVRIRFHFTSDGSVVAEGWYIDDFQVPSLIAVDENKGEIRTPMLSVYPNPFHSQTSIRWQPGKNGASNMNAGIGIYDITGRKIRTFSIPASAGFDLACVNWDGTDMSGARVAAGVYFVRLETGSENLTEKVLLLK
jgi:hypothetical protein